MTNQMKTGFHPSSEAFPPQHPLVSIVILAYNQLFYTQKCLESVQRHTYASYELIVVDNASIDGTDDYLISFRQQWRTSRKENSALSGSYCQAIKLIFNSTNLGFAAGNNAGIAIAEGDYIVLLNNDVVVTPNWLEKLLKFTATDQKIGIVGPMTNYVSGPQICQEIAYDTSSLEGLDEFAIQWGIEHEGESFSFWRIVGFCMLIARGVINKIGGLDTAYYIGGFEDDDFCVRAAIAGFKCAIAKDCFIHHYGSKSINSPELDYSKIFIKNYELFKRKWGWSVEKLFEYCDLSDVFQQPFAPERHYCPVSPLAKVNSLPLNQMSANNSETLRVDLGCGPKKPEGFIGVDIYPWLEVDIVADMTQGLPFSDSSVDEVRAHDVIEHLPDRIHTMNEIWRICKPNAMVDIFVPSTDGRGAFQDPTHVSFWNINSFWYYSIEFPDYLELCRSYGFQGVFSLISLENIEGPDNVIHVKVILKAIKPANVALEKNQLIEGLNLREINFVVFPDWNQPEEALIPALEEVVKAVGMHPDRQKFTLLIDTSNISDESEMNPDLVLAAIVFNVLLNQNIDLANEGAEISMLPSLGLKEWEVLFNQIHSRIPLPLENIGMVEKLKIKKICELKQLKEKRAVKVNDTAWNLQ
ncbi:MAG: glycosyltransferase [Microcoleus vaginatus WJT46-NPBG5]|jgi:GT2 family glycosyltransferase|nr:glycosyltransferase [Microcoleus vaginatus WJT46-NPBG5]